MADETRFIIEQLANAKLGYAVPPYAPAQFNDPQVADIGAMPTTELLKIISTKTESPAPQLLAQYGAVIRNQIFPLRLKKKGDTEYWQLPFECLFSLKGKNIITKRTVAKGKGRGSVKEHWTQDDYSINITGIFFSTDGSYPSADVKKLRSYCEAPESIEVLCPLLEHFDITRLVIEDFDFPHTKGQNVQAFSLNCTSDDLVELLISDTISIL